MKSIGVKASLVKAKKSCSNCLSKYILQYDDENINLDPITCPFCGYEIDNEEEIEDHEDDTEDDSWN